MDQQADLSGAMGEGAELSGEMDPLGGPSNDPPPQPRRGAGRPKGSKTRNRSAGGGAEAAPETPPGAEAGEGDGPKRRRRKINPDELGETVQRLLAIHTVAAGFLGAPEFMLTPQEAEMLAAAGLAAQREFGVEFGGKWAVLGTFAVTSVMIYAPRFKAVAARARARSNAASGAGRGDGPIINGQADPSPHAAHGDRVTP